MHVRPVWPWIVLFSMAATTPGAEPLPAVVKKVKPAVVTIVSFNPDRGMPSLGVGFLVAPDRIVSARHVVAAADRAEVRTASGATLRITGILAEDRPRDLVLLQLEKAPTPPATVEIATAQPEVGESIFTIGTPLGLEWTVSRGIVSAYRAVPDSGMVMQHTVQITGGSSGGAVFNMNGQVVAIQTATLTEGKETVSAGQGLNFAAVSRYAAALRPGPLRSLADCIGDVSEDWVPEITDGIGKVSLYPLASDNFEAALPFFEEAVRRQPKEPDVWFRLGLCQEKIAELDKATESYLKAIALRPNFGVALNNLGAIYNGQEKYEKALAVLGKAVQANPKFVEAHNSMAFAFYHLKKYREGAEAALRALELDPKHGDAIYYLALCSYCLGQKEKAQEQYANLLKIDANKARLLWDAIQALVNGPKEPTEKKSTPRKTN